MSFFTYKRDPGGIQVLRKGRSIEHYSGTMLSTGRVRPDPHMLVELKKKCRHIEDTLGIESTCNNVIWHWSWFEECPADSPILPLIRWCPGLYVYGFTRHDAERAAASCCPVYPLVEPNGSCIVIVGNVPIKVHNENVTVAEVETDEFDGFYHTMAAKHYHSAKLDQPYRNGSCYASYKNVAAWCEHHGITEAVAHEIVNVAKREWESK